MDHNTSALNDYEAQGEKNELAVKNHIADLKENADYDLLAVVREDERIDDLLMACVAGKKNAASNIADVVNEYINAEAVKRVECGE